MPAIDTITAPEGALQTHAYANLSYAPRGRNHRPSQGAVYAGRTEQALVCRWRQSSITGQLECAWGIERIVATLIEEDPMPASVDRNRHQRRIEIRKISMFATALMLAVVWLTSRLIGL